MKKRVTAIILVCLMAITMMPFAASAESGEPQGENGTQPPVTNEQNNSNEEINNDVQQSIDQDGEEKQSEEEQNKEENEGEEKADSIVSLSRGKKIKNKWGGKITGIKSNKSSGKDVLKYDEEKTYKITVTKGYEIKKVVVNGKNEGKINKVTLKGNGQPQSIKVSFKKGKIRIMLDAGHAGYYNQGIIKKYWESHMTWKLTNYLKKELQAYGIKCGMTKKSLKHDPSVYGRGRMAKGYDLFISIHSNWSPSASADYPLAIVSSKYKKKLYKKAQPLGKKLVKKIRSTMKTKQNYMVWVKRQRGGQDWYGVIRGAASVNVPGIILEHSFHSNRKKCKWLLKEKNLKKMAAVEAKTIAKHYGYIDK